MYEYIDWDCEVHTLFHPNNLGCKYAMHEAIQWFFSEEAYGIVLEDDIPCRPVFTDVLLLALGSIICTTN